MRSRGSISAGWLCPSFQTSVVLKGFAIQEAAKGGVRELSEGIHKRGHIPDIKEIGGNRRRGQYRREDSGTTGFSGGLELPHDTLVKSWGTTMLLRIKSHFLLSCLLNLHSSPNFSYGWFQHEIHSRMMILGTQTCWARNEYACVNSPQTIRKIFSVF